MSFAPTETSRYHGLPITLYKFTCGDLIYGYTDAEQAVEVASVTYEPLPIDSDALSSSGTLDKSTMQVRVPHDSEIAELFRIAPPSEVVGIVMFQGHFTDVDAEFLAVYSGRVLSCGRQDSTATLRCEPIGTSMRRPGLRQRYQYGCPHALYGTACGAIRADHESIHAVEAVGTGQVTLPDGWEGAIPAGKFTSGLMIWTHDGRTEVRQIRVASAGTNVVQIDGSTVGLVIGSSVTIAPGCNHQLTDCEVIFSNVQNFGGCPWIPTKNPLGFVNQYW